MTLYIGVDIHARQQTLSYLDTQDGTTGRLELEHERDTLGEAVMLSAQLTAKDITPMGMNYPNIDNPQLALNIMYWLSREV